MTTDPAPLRLTSPTLDDGGTIPVLHTCQGVNTSPAFAWTGGPSAASYALTLVDLTRGLVHAVLWDIPGSRRDLPAAIAAAAQPDDVPGAKQTRAYDNRTYGYLGPCPQAKHSYQWTLYALSVDALPVRLTAGRAEVVAAIHAHTLTTATLQADFAP
ncbi:MAG: YbhB/YbcL family Raf kinase inhibitor-like protein [Kofleriaceae bacterium]